MKVPDPAFECTMTLREAQRQTDMVQAFAEKASRLLPSNARKKSLVVDLPSVHPGHGQNIYVDPFELKQCRTLEVLFLLALKCPKPKAPNPKL